MGDSQEQEPQGSELPPELQRQLNAVELTEQQARAQETARHQVYQSLTPERSNAIRMLKCRELVLLPDCPEQSPDLLEIRRMYEANLISTEAIQRLRQDDQSELFAEMRRGGMLNNFQPTPAERAQYDCVYENAGRTYESVQEQMIADMLGTSGRPGSYHVLGLHDPEYPGKLHAWMSFRLPPPEQDTAASQAYVRFLQERLLNADEIDQRHMVYDPMWDFEKFQRDFATMGEIDTANVERGFGGAVFRLMHEMTRHIDERGLPSPGHMFYYRADALILNLLPMSATPAERLSVQNDATFRAAKAMGFYEMATYLDPVDIIARELPAEDGVDPEVFTAHTQWRFGQTNMKKLRSTAEGHVKSMRLV